MNNNLKKGVCYILSVMSIGCLSGRAYEKTQENPKETVSLMSSELNLNVSKGVNIFINDTSFTPVDINGNLVSPFI